MIEITLSGKPLSNQMIYKYTCTGNFPRMYMTKRGKDLKFKYQLEIKKQFTREPFEGDVELEVELYFGTKHRHDVDNYGKLILDAGEGALYNDDNQIKKLKVEKFLDRDNPRIELKIKEFEQNEKK